MLKVMDIIKCKSLHFPNYHEKQIPETILKIFSSTKLSSTFYYYFMFYFINFLLNVLNKKIN